MAISDPGTDVFISTRAAGVAGDKGQVFSNVRGQPQGTVLSAPARLDKGTLRAQETGPQGSRLSDW